jgi:hypothetical protein
MGDSLNVPVLILGVGCFLCGQVLRIRTIATVGIECIR